MNYGGAVPRINYDLPDDVHRRAKIAAARQGTTLREFVIAALDAAATRAEEKDD